MGHPARALEVESSPNTAPLGRIESAPGELAQAVDDWAADMRRRRKRDRSIEAFTGTVRAAMKSEGWSRVEALTFDAVTKYLGVRVASGQWAGNTHDRHLSAFRSLTTYLLVSGRIERDPLAGAGGIGDEEEQGSRAATTEEAAALVAMAQARQRADKRASGNRALVWACLFLAGCRISEPCGDESDAVPRGWQWGDLTLEESIPGILWQPESHKARRRILLPLHPDLAAALRTHRATVPHEPGDKVFPVSATRAVFRSDRERAGIAAEDREGIRFSPHSCRKWFRTALVEAGVQESLVGCLMRHQSGLAARYTQPSIQALNQGLLALPRIIPDNNFADLRTNALESVGVIRYSEIATNEVSPSQLGTSGGCASSEHSSLLASASSQPPRASRRENKPGPASSPAIESTAGMNPGIGILGLHPTADRIADWLEATARLLRGASYGPPDRQQARSE